MRDSANRDSGFSVAFEEFGISRVHLRTSKPCCCVVVGMDCNIQVPGEVEGVTGNGMWKHEFCKSSSERVDAVMKLLVKHSLAVVFTSCESISSFTRLHVAYLLSDPATLPMPPGLIKKLLNHAYRLELHLDNSELWGWPFSGGRLGALFVPFRFV